MQISQVPKNQAQTSQRVIDCTIDKQASDSPLCSLLRGIHDCIEPGGILLVTSAGFTRRGITAQIRAGFAELEKNTHSFHVLDNVSSHPQVSFVAECYEHLKTLNIRNVIALGGGSVIDVSKVLAGVIAGAAPPFSQALQNNISLCDFTGRIIAIPTTSGTGAEVTSFATLWDKQSGRKYSINCSRPHFVLFEPQLCLSLSRQTTLYCALDAISHAVESLWNVNRTQESETLALKALEDLIAGLPMVLQNSQDLEARRRLQWAAWRAGAAINITKTAVAHAISYPLTLQCGVPHGLACSFTLPAIIKDLGAEQLKISTDIADKLVELLENLSLEKEMECFTGWRDIFENNKFYLDPARSANFIFPVDTQWAKKIVLASS